MRKAGAALQKAQYFVQEPSVPSDKFYAGFWLRVDAFLTDLAALYIIALVSVLVLVLCFAYLTSVTLNEMAMIVFIFLVLFGLIGVWLYFSLFESSRKQATPGKLRLCIKVVDSEGSRISFSKATVRYFAKLLSGLALGMGYIMVGFMPKKQALHDKISECFVVKR